MTGRMGMEWRRGQIPACMKVTLKMARRKELVCLDFLMALSIKGNIKTTIFTGKGCTRGLMVDSMSGIGSITRCRAKALFRGVMVANMLVVMKPI
jgi:hypothetical protein